MSLALYYQIIGREIRIAENKSIAYYIDFTSNYQRFGKIETITVEKIAGKWEITQNGRVITHVPLDSLLDSGKPIILQFGKYAGMQMEYVPKDYLRFIVEKFEINAKNKHIIEKAKELLK